MGVCHAVSLSAKLFAHGWDIVADLVSGTNAANAIRVNSRITS